MIKIVHFICLSVSWNLWFLARIPSLLQNRKQILLYETINRTQGGDMVRGNVFKKGEFADTQTWTFYTIQLTLNHNFGFDFPDQKGEHNLLKWFITNCTLTILTLHKEYPNQETYHNSMSKRGVCTCVHIIFRKLNNTMDDVLNNIYL